MLLVKKSNKQTSNCLFNHPQNKGMQTIATGHCYCHSEALEEQTITRKLKTQIVLAMKLTMILLLATCISVSARTGAQTVTLNKKEASLKSVLKEVEAQTGYQFFFAVSLEQKFKPVTAQFNSLPLMQALEKIFANQDIAYKVFDKTIALREKDDKGETTYTPPPPPPIDVKGRVVDENGKAVIATVTVKGTNKLTATNDSGYFELKAIDENSILVITAVNIDTREVKVNGRTDLSAIAVISKVSETEGVTVNTGYQKLKPNEVNGSVFVVTNEMLNQQTGTNILERLDGVTSGLIFNLGKTGQNFQSKTSIVIRGHSTINGPLDPLVVLDNFPYEGDINNINPNDVESITILKDAAATSIWGARGGNGVIVITTKRGRFNQKLKVDLNTSLIIKQSPDLYSLPDMTIDDYIRFEEYLFNRGYFNSVISNTTTRPGLAPASEIFLKRRNGVISAADSASQIDALKMIDSRDQYNKYFYQNAITQRYSLNLSGGSGNIAWLISSSYDKSVSELKAKNDKLNLRLNNTYKPFKNLQINFGVYYTNNTGNSALSPSYNSIKVNGRDIRYLKFADENDNPLSVASYYRESYTDTAGIGKLLNWKFYPLTELEHNKTKTIRDDITANIGINYQMFKSLEINLIYQHQKQKSTSENIADIESFSTRDIINGFSQLNRNTGVVTYIVPMGDVLRLSKDDISSKSFRSQLNFNKHLGANHFVSAIAGAEIREFETNGNSVTYYGYKYDPKITIATDFVNRYPQFNKTTTSAIPGAPTLDPVTTNRFVSLFTNLAYNYKAKYSGSLSLRRDGSNVFGATTNDKWKPLWSAGLGWEMSKERFFRSGFVSYLRLKASYGFSGNVDLGKIPLPIGTYLSASNTSLPYMLITQLNDPSLRWEKVRQINLGVSFTFWKNIFSGSIEVYHKTGTDLYGPSPFNYTSGFNNNSITKNVANMAGNGIDLTLSNKALGKVLKWSSDILFSYRNEKTTKYFDPNPKDLANLISGGGNRIIPVVGKPLYAIAAYKWGGLNSSGNPQGYLNGQLSTDYAAMQQEIIIKGSSSESVVYIGSAVPTFFGSVMNTITWKGFSATINVNYKLGYYFVKPTLNYQQLFSSGRGHPDFEKRWRNPGDESYTNVPALVYTDYQLNGVSAFADRDNFYRGSEINVLRADNARIQFINLSYQYQNKSKKIPFQSARLYINISNVGIIWRANKEQIDPDYPDQFAPSKSLTVGFNAIF